MFGCPLITDDNLNATPIMIMLENGCELNLWSTLGHSRVAAKQEDNIQIYFPATAGGNYETWPLTLTYSPAARFVSIMPRELELTHRRFCCATVNTAIRCLRCERITTCKMPVNVN